MTKAAIARSIGASRAAVASWLRSDPDVLLAQRAELDCAETEDCAAVHAAPHHAYAYLLGLYLGDGCISISAKGVPRLRIMCCDDYPTLKSRCEVAIAAVRPGVRVGRTQSEGCTEIHADSRHWICLFPQHGKGRKHDRSIALAPWQQRFVDAHPFELLAGLIHSDGCRVTNRVRSHGRSYAYPRYFFSNVSTDIQRIFCETCDAVGVGWRQNRWDSISVARRASVAKLDAFVPRKT